jgi:hypothetical protein
MKTHLLIPTAIVGLLMIGSGVAQSSGDMHKEKMKSLEIMIGDWSGGGWMMTPQQQRVTYTQKETIGFELNGTVLRIRGEGFDSEGKQVHNALGIVYFDPAKDMFQMHSFLANWQQIIADMELTETGLNWWFKTEQGATIKYLITIIDDKWTEKGMYSPGGDTWFPFMEFSLEKVKR